MFDKNHLIKLTASVYRVTDLFPEKEPLKFLIRKRANYILESAVAIDFARQQANILRKILSNIALLEVYFDLSKTQNWLRPENFFILEIEYRAIDKTAKEMLESKNDIKEQLKPKEKLNTANDGLLLKPRQEKILKILKQNGPSQVHHISQSLPEYDKRVLRRDLSLLIEKGLVLKKGDKTKTQYALRV